MEEKDIRESLKKGWVRAIVTFEVAGKPASHVEKALKNYLDLLQKDERIEFLELDQEEAIEHEDGMFSAFAEIDMIVKNLETFNWICVNFSPASIEIMEPAEKRVTASEVTHWMNDLLAKIHEIGMNYRNERHANEHLTTAMNQLIRNSVLICIRGKTQTKDEISKETGIHTLQLDEILSNMEKRQLIKEIDGKYTVV
jgi:hypothetical protein